MGSRPSAPVSYRPTPTAPTIYQSVIPEADYQNLTNYLNELKSERAKKKKEREAIGLGDADMAARQKQYRQAEQDMYKASLPKTSLGSGGSTGTTP
tara:strand:+ start:18 stop:305 length:288 start_codon:yes stop_codon:yes gene_type:complete